MQIFWVSGPIGKIHSFNLSIKTFVACFAVLVILLISVGIALQFLGFRLALEYDPQIAREMGNLHTAVELENLNAVYMARIIEIENQLPLLASKLKELETINSRLVSTLAPSAVLAIRPRISAQGGSDQLTFDVGRTSNKSVLDAITQLNKFTKTLYGRLSASTNFWHSESEWFESLPLTLPLPLAKVMVSSEFGGRADPFTNKTAFHTGIDFDVPESTAILAAGSGVVGYSGFDSRYGNMVVIHHKEGFSTRYAHANQLLVASGDRVLVGQQIARSGSTGRSTGSHLHFEVMQGGKVKDPASYLISFQPNPNR